MSIATERQINFESEDDVRVLLLSYCGWTIAKKDNQPIYMNSRTTLEAVEREQARHLRDYFIGWDELHDAVINRIVGMGYDLNMLCSDYIPCTQGSPGDAFTIAKRVETFSDDDNSTIGLAELYIGRTKRSEEHTSELQSLMRISYAVFCLKNNKKTH